MVITTHLNNKCLYNVSNFVNLILLGCLKINSKLSRIFFSEYVFLIIICKNLHITQYNTIVLNYNFFKKLFQQLIPIK